MTTIHASYLPGDWVAISAPGLWLLVDLPPGHDTVQRCWSLVSDGAGVDDVLDLLVAGGIRVTPSFAIARLGDDERRAVVRGRAAIAVTGPDGKATTIASSGHAPWSDEPVDPVAELVLLRGGGESGSDVELPMAAGVTMAASIRVQAGDRATVGFPAAVTGASAPQPADAAEHPGVHASEHLVDSEAAAQTQAEPQGESEAEPEAEVIAVDAPSYDFLFGATQRPLPVDEVQVARAALPAPNETAGWRTLPPLNADTGTLDGPPSPDPPPTDTPAPHASTPPPGLIDALPWAPAADTTAGAPAWTPPTPAPPQVGTPPIVDLQPAARAPTSPIVDEPPELVAQTIDRASLRAALETAQDLPLAGPTVLAGRCPAGHVSPPHAAACRVCGTPMPAQQAFEIPRPPLGVLRLSTGDTVALDRGVLLGRAPTAPDSAVERPHLVRLSSPENDISRSHAEVVLDGWHVYVRDLGSTNGTTVTLPGEQPVRLRKNDLQLLEDGAVVTLADEVSATFEVIA